MDLFLDASDFDMLADFTDPTDVDPSFAPMPRERANTWHGRPRDIPKDDDSAHATPSFADDSIDETASTSGARDHVQSSAHSAVRKATARRNAWGNMSYADLIAKAIESSPDKRLTLSEIYAWLVENVPFFKDKGETNSSAGWKNSIRHNLSLHNRFMRVQNEGAGKSSWWMVNPDNRTVKAPRRRAATMDNSKALNQKRGRQRRSEPTNPVSSTNPSSTSGGDLDGSLHSFFTRSPEFRGRVSSNASSIGRLSPIPATFEVDMEPATSIAPSGAVFTSWNNHPAATTTADTLSDSLAGILMDDLQKSPDLAMTSGLELTSTLKTEPVFLQASSNANFSGDFFSRGQYPPPLHHAPFRVFGTSQPKTELFTVQPLGGMSVTAGNSMSGVSMLCVGGNMSGNGGVGMSGLQMNARQQLYKTPSVNDIQLQVATTPGQLFSGPLTFAATPEQRNFSAVSQSQSPPGVASMQWPGQQEWSARQQKLQGQSVQQWPKQELENTADVEPQIRQRSFTFSSGKLDQKTLKQLLAAKPCLRTDIQKLLQMKRQQLYAAEQLRASPVSPQAVTSSRPPDNPVPLHSHHSMLEQLLTGAVTEHLSKPTDVPIQEETKMDETPSAFPSDLTTTLPNDLPLNPPSDLPNDIDLSYLNTESTTDIECNIDQIIQHELTFGDDLDFSFDPVQPNWGNNVGSSGDSLTNFLSY